MRDGPESFAPAPAPSFQRHAKDFAAGRIYFSEDRFARLLLDNQQEEKT